MQSNRQRDNSKQPFLLRAQRSALPLILLLLVVGLWPALQTLAAARTAAATERKVVREYVRSEEEQRLAELQATFGQHKTLPPGYELQALLALSHFPELRDVRIRFVVNDVDIPLSSRPWWASMLRSAKQRTYLVVIDTERSGDRQALLLGNQPFNAQIGILGHELAHTVYYLERSFFGIVADALCQLSDCRLQFERDTDRRLLDYGLGWQRYDHALYVRAQLTGDSETALDSEGGGGAYMSPAELQRLIDEHPAYQSTAN